MSQTVTFVIGVLNERERLPHVLRSIRAQRGIEVDVEIIVADGGSTDGTQEFARAEGCRVLHNPLGRCEPGISLGMAAATGDVVIIMAADNPLDNQWFLRELMRPFEDPLIFAAVPNVVGSSEDPWTVQYLNLFTDPFNHFVYWNRASQLTFRYAYPVLEEGAGYTVYDLGVGDPPMIGLAQGFAVRRAFVRPPGSEEDDLEPVEALIESGKRVAVVPGARIRHHTASNYWSFIAKFEPRIRARLRDRTMAVWRRTKTRSFGRRARRAVWPLYATSFVAPAAVALYGLLRDRRAEWLLHPFLSFGLALVFWKQLILSLVAGTRGVAIDNA